MKGLLCSAAEKAGRTYTLNQALSELIRAKHVDAKVIECSAQSTKEALSLSSQKHENDPETVKVSMHDIS